MDTRRRLVISLLFFLFALPASASAYSEPYLAGEWPLDGETGVQYDTCPFVPPRAFSLLDKASTQCIYWSTPDLVNRYDVGPYYPDDTLKFDLNGRFGHSLSSTNQWMAERSATSGLQAQRLTVMVWVKNAGYPGSIQYLIAEGDDGATCSKASWALYTGSVGLRFYVSPYGGSPVLSPAMTDAQSAALWDGNWHMVAGTYDGAKVHFYVDGGNEIGTGSPIGNQQLVDYFMTDKYFYMDGFFPRECNVNNTYGLYGDYKGEMDEARVYTRALSPSELDYMEYTSTDQPPVFDPADPLVHTTAADQIAPTGARLNGTIDDHGLPTQLGYFEHYHFEYGTTTAYGHSTPVNDSAGTGLQAVHATISGLDPQTTYHYRLVAGASNQSESEDMSFKTNGVPLLRFSAASYTAGEGDGTATLTVNRVGGDASDTATVHYATSDDSAAAGSDYTATSGTLTFSPGQSAKTISVPIVNDPVNEPDESFKVTLSSPSATATLGTPSQATVQIADNDPLPQTTIALDPAAPDAGDFYTGPVTVTVSANGHAPTETRCVLDPPQAPATFDDIAPGCSLSGTVVSDEGRHNVYAATRDAAGTGPVAQRSFAISALPDTTITEGPSGLVWTLQNFFAFRSPTEGARFDCRLDGGDFTACTTPLDTGTLQSGEHTFQVRAIAPGGAADPTPATQTFTIGTEVVQRLEGCTVSPTWRLGREDLPDGCVFGRDTGNWLSLCSAYAVCIPRTETCPPGAYCTVTAIGDFSHDDGDVEWGLGIGSGFRGVYNDEGGTWNWDGCRLSWHGPRECHLRLRVGAIGQEPWSGPPAVDKSSLGSPLFATCYVNWESYGGNDPAVHFRDASRRIDCQAVFRIEDIAPLNPVLLAAIAQILVPLAGDLTVTGTIPGAGSRAAVASRSRPRISPFHATVDHAGPLTFRLKLNRAAKRLLARRHKLRVNLTTTLKPAVGSAITRRKRATVVSARTKPAACPKHGSRRGKVHCGKRPRR